MAGDVESAAVTQRASGVTDGPGDDTRARPFGGVVGWSTSP